MAKGERLVSMQHSPAALGGTGLDPGGLECSQFLAPAWSLRFKCSYGLNLRWPIYLHWSEVAAALETEE